MAERKTPEASPPVTKSGKDEPEGWIGLPLRRAGGGNMGNSMFRKLKITKVTLVPLPTAHVTPLETVRLASLTLSCADRAFVPVYRGPFA